METFLIDSESLIVKDLLCQIDWESVSIVKFERILTCKDFCSLCFHVFFKVSKDLKSFVDRVCEALLLLVDDAEDHIFLLFQFRITVLGEVDHNLGELCHEVSFDPEDTSVTCSSS